MDDVSGPDAGPFHPLAAAGVLVGVVVVAGLGAVFLGAFSSPACACSAPVSFQWEYDPGASPSLQATHAGGDTLDGSRLAAEVTGGEATVTLREGNFTAGDELVAATQGLDPGETVRIVWHGPDGDVVVLGEYEL